MNHKFEDVEVKENGISLLEESLKRKRKKCMIGLGASSMKEYILNYCKEAKVFGIICFGMGVTLREGNREYFYSQLDKKFPKLKERYIREYGNNYVANSGNDKKLMGLFHEFCERNGIVHDNEAIFNYLNLFEGKNISKQLSFFDEV